MTTDYEISSHEVLAILSGDYTPLAEALPGEAGDALEIDSEDQALRLNHAGCRVWIRVREIVRLYRIDRIVVALLVDPAPATVN